MAKRKTSSRNLFDQARHQYGGTPRGASSGDSKKFNTKRYRRASSLGAQRRRTDLRKLRNELGPVAWQRWVKYGELPASHGVLEPVSDETATNALKRDLVARIGGNVEDARELYNATCEDLHCSINEPLTGEEAAQVRRLLDI